MVIQPRRSRALTFALTLALVYVGVSGLYIIVSGQLAARLAASLPDLQELETMKGLAFVVVTGLLLFGLAYFLFRRIEQNVDELARNREALLAADRRATPGLLAASIAHDFNNVLSVIGTSIELLEGADPELIADLGAAVRRGGELAKSLSSAGKSSASGEAEDCDVARVVGEAVALSLHHSKSKRRSVALDLPPDLRLRVYPTLVHQVVTNLVLNGLDAVSDGGRLLVRLARRGDGVCLEVHDDGPGVPEAVVSKLFDPFFTTKPDGTGLGLLSVRSCAELHAGNVRVGHSDALGGALFEVLLHPVPSPATEPTPSRAAPRPSAPRSA